MTSFEQYADSIMMDNPEWAKLAYEIKSNLNRNKYDWILVDQIMQNINNKEYNHYDIFYFMKVYSGILSGRYLVKGIYLGSEPESDSEVNLNNKRLKKLPHSFIGEFKNSTGSGYNDDGFIKWDKSQIFLQLNINNEGTFIKQKHEINPFKIPLEVGYVKSERVYEHLEAHGGVARWAYNHEYIHVFLYNNFKEMRI